MKYAKFLNEDSTIFQRRFIEIIGDTATQAEVADNLKTSRQNVGNWLKGETKPDIFALAEIAKKYNVSTDYLLGLSDIKTTDNDIKVACEVTGLSEETLIKSELVKKVHNTELNILLQSRRLGELLETISKYIDVCRRAENEMLYNRIKLPDIDKTQEKSEDEQAEIDATILLENYGYIILQSDYDIKDFYRQKISSLLEDIFNDIEYSAIKKATKNAKHNTQKE